MLYIIATPIGNLKDISLRALECLGSVDYLLAEDTRKAGLLLSELKIANKPKLISFYDEVEDQKTPEILRLLERGATLGLVTDAGTPVISDPGFKLIKKCRKLGLEVTSIPGASAAINALVLSGMPSGRFCFLGFLPKKESDRRKVLSMYKEINGAKVVFERRLRIKKLIADIKTVFGEKVKLAVCREMTKKFEEVLEGTAAEIDQKLSSKNTKGEMVVVFEANN